MRPTAGRIDEACSQLAKFAYCSHGIAALSAWQCAGARRVVVQIDKSSQRMSVSVNGATRYNWPVSTGRDGYGTPSGVFQPQRLARRWYSRKYYNSPMPYSIFFYYGFAIHGTSDLARLGGPASHGCVRLSHRTRRRCLRWCSATPRNTRIMVN